MKTGQGIAVAGLMACGIWAATQDFVGLMMLSVLGAIICSFGNEEK